MLTDNTARSVRPYQLACLFCRAGAQTLHPTQERVAALSDAIRQTPDLPLMLRCNLGDLCAYQNCGTAEDTPEGADFNRKRDADLLQWLDLAPGTVLPARLLLKRLLFRLASVKGVCGYARVTGPAWTGCAKSFSGDYERGRERGIEAVIPARTKAEMAAEKERSMQALGKTGPIPVRPHLLLCAVCQYGGGTRPPYREDNLPELLEQALAPACRLRVELVTGATWAICASCPQFTAAGCCVTGRLSGAALYNEAKDLNVLQAMGLTYGTVMGARDLFRLILERIPTADGVCALNRVPLPDHSFWLDGCHRMVFPGPYEKGRAALWAALGCAGTPDARPAG
jgi:hypothetical protein